MALLVSVGCIVLWIHPFGQAKSNIQTNLGQPESGRLRFSLKIRVRPAGLGSRRSGHDLKQKLSPFMRLRSFALRSKKCVLHLAACAQTRFLIK